MAVKSVLTEIPESAFLVIRFTSAMAILFLYLIVTKEGIRIERSDIGKILWLGVLGVGIYNILWTLGIHLTTASNAALIISTSPLFAQLYMEFIHKAEIGYQRWIFTLLSFYGVFLMISQSWRMFYIIIFGTVAAYICWYTGIKKTGPVKVILFHYIVPVSSMILGALFLREPVSGVRRHFDAWWYYCSQIKIITYENLNAFNPKILMMIVFFFRIFLTKPVQFVFFSLGIGDNFPD